SIARGRQAIERNLDKGAQLGKITEADREQTLDRIRTTTQLEDLSAAELIIEAAPEKLELKRQLLRECEAIVGASCIFASNTSSLSISEIAAAAARPENVVGMHFFNPVHLMRLVEIVIGDRSSEETVTAIQAVA